MKKLNKIILITIIVLLFTTKDILLINNDLYSTYYYEYLNIKLKKYIDFDKLIKSIIIVESNDGLYTLNGDQIGHMQIRPILVKDVNKIIGEDRYTHDDAWDKDKSIEMFLIYQSYYNPDMDIEKGARIWNGGPAGEHKPATTTYWNKVKAIFDNDI